MHLKRERARKFKSALEASAKAQRRLTLGRQAVDPRRWVLAWLACPAMREESEVACERRGGSKRGAGDESPREVTLGWMVQLGP